MITDEMVELGCAAISQKRGYDWPSSWDEEELRIGRENMRAALSAALSVEQPTQTLYDRSYIEGENV